MKFCRCNNYEHNEHNIDCPHNDEMDYVLFTRAISENFSLDGKQRWSDSDVINFMIEDLSNEGWFEERTKPLIAIWELHLVFQISVTLVGKSESLGFRFVFIQIEMHTFRFYDNIGDCSNLGGQGYD